MPDIIAPLTQEDIAEGAIHGPTREGDEKRLAQERIDEEKREEDAKTNAIKVSSELGQEGVNKISNRTILPPSGMQTSTPSGVGMSLQDHGFIPTPPGMGPQQPQTALGAQGGGGIPDLSVYDVSGTLLYTGTGSLTDGNGNSYVWQQYYSSTNAALSTCFVLSTQPVAA